MPVSCPSLLLYCVIWLCSKFIQCHKSPAQLIPSCRASAGATERGGGNPSTHSFLPCCFSGNLCIRRMAQREFDGGLKRLHWDSKFSLGESKFWLFSNCYIDIANLITDPRASPRALHFIIKSLNKIRVLCPQHSKTQKSTVLVMPWVSRHHQKGWLFGDGPAPWAGIAITSVSKGSSSDLQIRFISKVQFRCMQTP